MKPKAKGIDVSVYQKDIDYEKVKKAGYSFVMIRAGYGKYTQQKDTYFEQNYRRAKNAGLHIGAYWYSYAVTPAEAREEANTFLKVIAGKTFDYPLAFDIEDNSQRNLSVSTISAIISAFCKIIEDAGYYAILYSYASFLENKVSKAVRGRYDIWVAHFDVSTPSYDGSYGMWQYTSKGNVNGVSGKCDLDYAYKDYPSIIKSKQAKTKIPSKQEQTATTNTEEKIDKAFTAFKSQYVRVANDVIAGKYGNGQARITALKAKGYDPDIVQSIVNILV